MRTGPRVIVVCALMSAALCSPARADDTLSVFTDNAQIALGAVTTLAAHAETDAGYGGGYVTFKYKAGSENCAASPAEDDGIDATDGEPSPVDPGAVTADVGGQTIQLGVGSWRVCGWLIDNGTGAPVAGASSVGTVVPYIGSISVSVKRIKQSFEIVLSYTTSAPAKLYAVLQKGGRACAKKPKFAGKPFLLVPRKGRVVGSDGGLGKSVAVSQLAPGTWRVCSWLSAKVGGAGPATKTLAVPRASLRGGHVGG